MPGLLFQDEDINRQPETDFLPRYGPIATLSPPQTIMGDIPTPPSNYGGTVLQYPPDYSKAKNLLPKDDPKLAEQMRLMLQLLYRNKWNREG